MRIRPVEPQWRWHPPAAPGRAVWRQAGIWLMAVMLHSSWAADPGFSPGRHHIENWHIDDGLPQSSVTAICQARSGYLWLGTRYGLVRFDGVRFKVFSPDTVPAFPGNRITCVFEDSQRAIWFGLEGSGVGRLKGGEVSVPRNLPVADNTVNCIAEDLSGGMWFGTMRGDVIRQTGGKVQSLGPADGLPGDPVRGLVVDAGGTVWAATARWFGRLQQGKFVRHPWVAAGDVTLAPRRQGGVWLADQKGVAELSSSGGRQTFSLPPGLLGGGPPPALVEDRKGAVWIGSNGRGVIRLFEGKVETIGVREGLGSDVVLAMTEDVEGNFWAATLNGGLDRLRQRVFEVLDARNGLPQDNVFSICEDTEGVVWLGTGGGLFAVRKEGGITRYGSAHGLANEQVTAVWEDRQRNLLAGTWGGGLFRRNGGQFEPFATERGFDGKFIRGIYEDPHGRLWVGTQLKGAYCIEESGVKNYDAAAGLAHSDVRAILCDRTGAVWFGTGGGGLSCLRDGQFTTITSAHGLPSDFVRVLHEDENGVLWAGTSRGLVHCHQGKLVSLQTKHGLPDNVISQIFRDRRRTFWFGSNRGIFRVGTRELEQAVDGLVPAVRCSTYTKADGLSGRECNGGNQPSGCQTRDGRLWFPTPQGVAIVDPANLRLNARPPVVLIEEAVADGRPLPLKERPDDAAPGELAGELAHPAAQLRVPAGCKRLEIQYTGINFTAPRRVQFKYRLTNYDPDWIDAGDERTAIYGNPPPGNYVFQVRAVNSDGVWNELGSGLAVTVLAPYWRTWWFLSLSTTGGLGLIAYGVRQVSVRKLQRMIVTLEQEHALAAERSRIAADMHDQIGSRLTQISLLGELARREAGSPETLSRQLDKITAESREVAKSLDEIVWTVKPSNDTLDRTAAYIVHYTEEFFESTPMRCRLDVPTTMPAHMLSAERRHDLFLAFKEALNNVAKHARATEVFVRLAVVPDGIELTIRDNGRGFATAGAAGNGLPNMRKRIAALGGRFELSSQPGQGTSLTFHVPMAFAPAAKAATNGEPEQPA